ncbi:hypothetical protein ACP4OV_016000 [Aristida adscensionis]
MATRRRPMPRRRVSPPPPPPPHHLAGVVAVAAFLLATAVHARAQQKPPPWVTCGLSAAGSYAENSTYAANVGRLAATLPCAAAASPVLYATGSAGAAPDAVHALALCRGDAAAGDCDRCVAAAFRGARQGCPLNRDVLIFDDLCQLRFSDHDLLAGDGGGGGYLDLAYTYLSDSRVAGAPAASFDAAVRRLVDATAGYAAAANSTRRFGTGAGEDGGGRPGEIYAVAQCTPDKTVEVCRECLGTITGKLQTADFSGRSGGGVFGMWCSFRYETYPFFSGPPLIDLPAFVPSPPPPPPPPVAVVLVNGRRDKSRNRTGIVVLGTVLPTILVLVAISLIIFWRRRISADQSFVLPLVSYDLVYNFQGKDMHLVDLSTIRDATQNFAESRMLGKGGFGMVYKGILPEGQEVAVKRLCQSSRQGMGELKSELVLVSKLHHKNLVRLIGVCLQEQEKILVYEYMANRSLDTILFDSERHKELDWGKRFKIINGIARGLQYLHEDSQLKIVHRDLKASNILLDTDYAPKISDFGLAKIFGGDQSTCATLRIAGTYGYMAPEYAMCGQYSIKSDVFSFGILVLEIVTGRRNCGSYKTKRDVDLLNLVLEHWIRGNVIELIDPSLCEQPCIEQLLKCVHVGLLCLQRRPAARPTMSWVNVVLGSSSSTTVCLPSLSMSAFFFIQDVGESDRSDRCALASGYCPAN